MLNKIYLGLLAIAVIIASVLIYFSYSWLLSIGNPTLAAENFNQYSTITWTYIWISFLILLVFANYLVWTSRKAWIVWTAFGYFAIFIILHTFWLSQGFTNFQEANNLAENTISVTPFVGVAILIAVGIGVFFAQYIVLRLRDKIDSGKQPLENEI